MADKYTLYTKTKDKLRNGTFKETLSFDTKTGK